MYNRVVQYEASEENLADAWYDAWQASIEAGFSQASQDFRMWQYIKHDECWWLMSYLETYGATVTLGVQVSDAISDEELHIAYLQTLTQTQAVQYEIAVSQYILGKLQLIWQLAP